MTATAPSKRLVTRRTRLDVLYADYEDDPAFIHLRYGTKFVPGRGSTRPKVMFVADIPTHSDAAAGQALTGKENALLNDLLRSIDLKGEHIYFTHILKYRPPKGRDPRTSELYPSLTILWDEMAVLKPRVVVPLGRFATSCFFDRMKFADVIGQAAHEDGEDYTYIPTHGLTTLLHNPSLRGEMVKHFMTIANHL